jgi:ferredoxin-NADP reductase
MEWTLPHSDTDSRGSRRYFTIASSPTEEDIRIGIKFFDKGSSFKDALLDIDQNSQIVASQISGNFIMPKDKSKKLVFIAGGIGITPYRSMIKYLIDKNQKRDVILLYSVTNDKEISYKKIFEQARESLGIKTIYTVTDDDAVASESNTRKGFINAEFIKREVPDYQDRIFYISGTQGMVSALYKALISLGVSRKQIKTDYFPGYTPKK